MYTVTPDTIKITSNNLYIKTYNSSPGAADVERVDAGRAGQRRGQRQRADALDAGTLRDGCARFA